MARRPFLAAILLVHAAVLAAAGILLPWHGYTLFAVLSLILAGLHVVTAAVALLIPDRLDLPLRILADASLAYQGYLAYVAIASGLQLVAMHGAIGTGLAVAIGAVWVLAGMFTIPVAMYGLFVTGGVRVGKATATAVGMGVLLIETGAALRVHEVQALPLPAVEVAQAARPGAAATLSLRNDAPTTCEHAPSPDRATVLVTINPGVAARAETHCLQGTPAVVSATLTSLVGFAARPVKIDVVRSVRHLDGVFPHEVPFALRGGEDGVCAGNKCLTPWQLVGRDLMEGFALAHVDARLGVDPDLLRKALEAPPGQGLEGLTAIRTRSLLLREDGTLADLSPHGGELAEADLRKAVAGAEDFLLAAQDTDGRFLYQLDAVTGEASFQGFSLPRQAGATLVLCELGENSVRVDAVVDRSLSMLASLETRDGDRAAILQPGERGPVVHIGSTALTLATLLTCRDRVGNLHDPLIGRLARTLLALQRPDGSLAPAIDTRGFHGAELGYQPLYAEGQAVLALVKLEDLAKREPSPDYPGAFEAGQAAGNAMRYFGEDYHRSPARDFLFVEENWHCLAARAALGSHRVPSYERFCLDYVTFKSRFVVEGLDPAYDGGNSLGNVTVPLTTNTAGFGEALAAAFEVARVRGEPDDEREHLLRLTLGYVVRSQLDADRCFDCDRARSPIGAFTASPVSPQIRIDYLQHAWAALGHGGRALGLLPPAPTER